MAGGRPPIFKTPEAMKKAFDEYCNDPEKNKGYISKTGFALSYGFNRILYNEYRKKPEFSNILAEIEDRCKQELIRKGLTGEFNSAIVKLVASASYGMSEKNIVDQNIEANVNVTMTSLLDEDLKD